MTGAFPFAPDRETMRRLVSAVTPDDSAMSQPSEHDVREIFARAAWTGIAEPGDRAATLLVSALGAWGALIALHEAGSTARLLSVLRDAVAGDDRDWAGDGAAASTVFSATDALAIGEREWAAALARWQPRLDTSAAERHLHQAVMIGAQLITPASPLWPCGVDDLGEHAPLALWSRGSPDALDAARRSIALVGARAATGYGEHVALEASAGLVDRGFAIVSGAAYGIDGAAHRAALASRGTTIAFLAGGVDRFYPSGHESLLARIAREGVVLSELPCGAAPTRWRFLQRNRLIAAASRATIVLEAGWRSGSLNTAGHAASLGRPLGAVPGPVTSPTSAGCHRLLREYDAVCVTDPDQMAELVDGVVGEAAGGRVEAVGPTPEERRVLDALSVREARHELDLARRSGLSVAAVQSALGALALDGGVAERPGGWVRGR
jgi:DNA processing protein